MTRTPNGDARLVAVTDPSQIRSSLRSFARGAVDSPGRAAALLKQTWYWIYDPESDDFGPGKFVGFVDMDFATYGAAIKGFRDGVDFNGAITRKAIERAIGRPFARDAKMANHLYEWGAKLLGPGVFKGVGDKKWRFLSLSGG